jgi:hypothetical protein
MKYHLQFIYKTLFTSGWLLSMPSFAETRHVTVPSYQVKAGSLVEVPIKLDNAAGLAALRIQVNYDPKVIVLEIVKAGPLGEDFDFSHETTEQGIAQLTFARADALSGGSGRLASLRFRANLGADVDLVSQITLADVSLADATGVVDLRQKDTLLVTNGELSVSASSNIDNTGSGLPDWWELQHGLDPYAINTTLDHDGDGVINLLEYAFGGNPKVADSHARGARLGRSEVDGNEVLSIGFHRRKDDLSLSYRVEESRDLLQWQSIPISQQPLGLPVDQGDGTEYVEVVSTLFMDGPQSQPKGFLRVVVDKPE